MKQQLQVGWGKAHAAAVTYIGHGAHGDCYAQYGHRCHLQRLCKLFHFCASTKVPLLFWFLSCKPFSRFQDFCHWIHDFLHLPSVRLCMEVKSISVWWSPLASSLCILQLTISRILPQVDCVWFWYSSRDRFSDCRSLGFCVEMIFC